MSRDHLVLFAILFQYHVCYGPFRTHTLARTLRCNQCVVNLSLCISFPIEFFSLADVERTTWIFNRYEQAFNWNFRLLYLSTGINLVIFSVCFCVFLGVFLCFLHNFIGILTRLFCGQFVQNIFRFIGSSTGIFLVFSRW